MTLRDIRRQLKSIESVKKITDAVERVAAAHLRRAQTKAEQSQPYIAKMKKILEHVASTGTSNPLFENRAVKKTAVVVITADKGLAGSFNSNILSKADKFLKNYTHNNVDLLLFGRKGIEYYHKKKWNIRLSQSEWTKMSIHEIHILSDKLVHWFLSGEYDEIWFVYTHYITMAKRNVVVEKFLNISKSENIGAEKVQDFIFEPNTEEILSEILPRYCLTRIQTAFYESHASELASRIIAMQAASKNSEEMIEKLTLIRNKARQAEITKEMIEISAGAKGSQ